MQEQFGTGRRKTAVASVRIREGKGAIDVNGKAFETYFPSDLQRKVILEPIEKANQKTKMDIIIRVRGGGLEAQAVAVRLGLSRALVKDNADTKPALKECGFLTRDSRKREREKYGRAGARKRYQFSKR
jgi:small subunit ribosomal protein S9